MARSKTLILSKKQVSQKIRRMAYEIYEHNFTEKELIIAGIYDRGYALAKRLVKELEEISPLKLELVRVSIDKVTPTKEEISLDYELKDLKKKSVVLVDDVLNTGKTMSFSLKAFLGAEIRKMEAAVLIDRSHKLFPIDARYKGYELSTTLNEHVEVKLTGTEQGVYLS